MKEDKIREGIGELLTREKYRFMPNGLIAEVVRDFLEVIDGMP